MGEVFKFLLECLMASILILMMFGALAACVAVLNWSMGFSVGCSV